MTEIRDGNHLYRLRRPYRWSYSLRTGRYSFWLPKWARPYQWLMSLFGVKLITLHPIKREPRR